MAFPSLMIWSHNSLSFALGTLLLAMLYELLLQLPREEAIPPAPLAALSLGAGLLASITIYLAAWAVGFGIIVAVWGALNGVPERRTWGSVLVVALGSMLGFGLGVIPVLDEMSGFFQWIAALVTHQSPYLLAPQEAPLLTQWAGNLGNLIRRLPVLFATLLILAGMAAFAHARRREQWRSDATSAAFTIGLLSTCLLLMLFIMDHPKPDYMLAVAAVMPMLTLTVLNLNDGGPSSSGVLKLALPWLVLLGVLLTIVSAVRQQEARASMIRRIERQTNAVQEEYARVQGRAQQGLVVVWTYGTYSPCFSWWFGNEATDNAFRREIGKLCPRQLAYDIWGQMVIPRQGARPLERTSWDIIIGCSEAFKTPAMSSLPYVETFADLPLACGNLTVAYRDR